MALFKISDRKLEPVNEKKIDLENDIQKLTEENLEAIFGLRFICGALNQEFCIRVNEQDFYIDTVALDGSTNSIVLIEYKKDRSFSVIDQGFAYLSAMLNNKAEFVLEINERIGKKFTKKDIDWEQSRVIFISNEFTNYQKNAINFRDLPMFLYEVQVFENGIVDYNPIKPFRTSESINKFIKDKSVQNVTKEVKVYSIDDHFKPDWNTSRESFETLRKWIIELDQNITEKVQKHYIAYKLPKNGQQYNFCEVVPQASGLMVHLDINKDEVHDPGEVLVDCSRVGHWATGNVRFKISEDVSLEYAMTLLKQAYEKIKGI